MRRFKRTVEKTGLLTEPRPRVLREADAGAAQLAAAAKPSQAPRSQMLPAKMY
jgi:ribosomal protein S21